VKYRPSRRVRIGVLASTFVVLLLSALGLVGQLSGDLVYAGAFGSLQPIVPTTAISLIVLAAAVSVRIHTPRRRGFITAACAAVGAVAALELVDWVTSIRVAPDRLFATSLEMDSGTGRMSPLVAVALAAVAAALVLSYSARRGHRELSQWMALMVGNGGFVLCVGFAFGSPILENMGPWPPALPAAVSLMLLGLAAAALTADTGPLSVFVGDSVRAQLMRAVMPVVIGTALAFAAVDSVHHLLGIEQSPMLAGAIPIVGIVAVSLVTAKVAQRVGGRIDSADAAREEALVQLEHGNERLERMLHDVVLAMDRAVEVRDPYTQGHERRVAALSRRIAKEMGLSGQDVEGVEIAALLHDIGKLRVPAGILAKPRKLTGPEMALVREHAACGADILSDIDFPWPIAKVVGQHHERLDGSGYPKGLVGDEIHEYARILAAADVIEAMSSHRPWRPSLGVDAAMDEIRGEAHGYDPRVISACERLHAHGALVVS
jgi:putative nucleotidyltransferase with HDIG domain